MQNKTLEDHANAVTAARAALEGARASHRRCPSGENWLKVEHAQNVMNGRLDLWATAHRASSVAA